MGFIEYYDDRLLDIKYYTLCSIGKHTKLSQSLYATCEVCGGTREALAIRRTLFDRQ